MSNLPAWKRALLEKKKQQEQEEEIKKKQEQEAYIKSLPAWKRAIIMRDMEKNKSASSPSSAVSGNAPISPQPAAGGKDKWKAALSVSKASPSPAKPAESPAAKTNGPLAGSVGARGSGQLPAISRESTSSAKPPWVRTDSPTSPTSPAKPNTPTSISTTDAPSPRTLREQKRGAVQSIAGQFRRPASSSQSPPVSPGFRGKKETTPQPKVEVLKKEPTQSQGGRQDVLNSPQPAPATSPAATVQIDDSDLVGLPSWKRALILKKRMKQAGLTSLPPAQQSQPGNNATPTSSGRDETDGGTPLSPKAAPSKSNSAPSSSSKPNVVNRSDDSVDPGSNKLVQKEGVTLRPPIFNEVDQWANVSTDDPKFVKLPPWKQAMILRRRKDIAKRSGQETSPPESPTVKTVSEKRKGSTPSDSGQSQGKKSTKKPTAKTSGKMEEKRATSKAPTKSEDKKTSTKKTKDKNEAEETSKTSTGKKSSSGGRLKPVRSAPTRPPEKKEKEVPKVEVPKVEVPKVEVPKVEEDKEEPMFTWSFSKHSVETGDAMSASSDSELEDVQITSIDDELSDEDDSGIGGSGGTILMSYKPLEEERETKEKSESPQRTRSMSSSSSDPEIKTTMTRSESKSILADPAKKSYKSMRRVSFSDSSLHTEHFYPKYDYSDYDEIEQELPDIFGRGKLRNVNTGLSHRLHPSLRTDNDTNSDSYRYGFNSSAGGNPSSPSPSSSTDHSPSSVGLGGGGGLSSYKPSMLSSFDSLGTFSHSPTPTLPSPIKEEASAEADADSDKVDGAEDDSTDFYSTLNADTAALLW